ncbi:uncharacterized protein LOC132405257 [Hypanus sabinus]|uniref:uncharacterized protein LOC132405257 n=1 Tax=Hypanus sabinus TaxID=79690 RepID=UPI0028C3D750|nr:uncharacterized protein LOC132405257 [Hypanus sabinus]
MPRHGVQHHIPTQGPPLHACARRLPPDKLRLAKEEFQRMEELGIIRRSDSPWASPLHMVPKATGGWRLCGDYRRLNEATTPDRYPVPHIQDFAANLHGARIFSKVDLAMVRVPGEAGPWRLHTLSDDEDDETLEEVDEEEEDDEDAEGEGEGNGDEEEGAEEEGDETEGNVVKRPAEEQDEVESKRQKSENGESTKPKTEA